MPLVRRAPSGEQAPAPLPMMAVDEKERRRRAMMGGGGGAMSATVSTMQTNAAFSKSINGETDTMQMMRQAVRSKMIESASMKKLGVEPGAVGAAVAAAPPSQDPPAAKNVLKKSFSSSMPVLRNSIQDLSGGKAMGHLIKGFDELSDEQSVNALRYIQFTCEKLGLNTEKLPCAQKILSAEASLKGSFPIAEEEEELSLEDMEMEAQSQTRSDALARSISEPL